MSELTYLSNLTKIWDLFMTNREFLDNRMTNY